MASRTLSPFPLVPVQARVGLGAWRSSLWLFVVGTCGIVSGCGGQLPSAPVETNLLTISGRVYTQGTASGEPAIGDVLITVQEGQGSVPQTTLSNGAGFYSVVVQAGTISITASKVGYTSRESNFDLSNSTVLNFSLTPSRDDLSGPVQVPATMSRFLEEEKSQ